MNAYALDGFLDDKIAELKARMQSSAASTPKITQLIKAKLAPVITPAIQTTPAVLVTQPMQPIAMLDPLDAAAAPPAPGMNMNTKVLIGLALLTGGIIYAVTRKKKN